MSKIAVLGTGAWATALANVLADSKHSVKMYGISEDEVNDINSGFNRKFYGDIKINTSIKASLNLNDVINNVEYILIAIPSIYIKKIILELKEIINNDVVIINASKGLDYDTNFVFSETIKKILGQKIRGLVSLVGPSFAIDVIKKSPTIINSVSYDIPIALDVACLFNTNYFKVLPWGDEIGAELCSALKNFLAIAIGIVYESHNSINTISAILALGINEIKLIITAFKANELTILQLCGIGDIFLTCSSEKSRNFSFGNLLYRVGLKTALKESKTTVEGYNVFPIVQRIVNNMQLNLPIMSSLCHVLSNELEPKKFINKCMKLIGF